MALATGRNAAELEPRLPVSGPSRWRSRTRAAALDLPRGTDRVHGDDALVALATRDDVDLVIVGTGGVVSSAARARGAGVGQGRGDRE